MPPDFSGLTDQELQERYSKADLQVRQMLNWSPRMYELDNLLSLIRDEQARRKEERYGERCTD